MNLDGALIIWILAGLAAGIGWRLWVPIKDWLKARFTTRLFVTSGEEAYYWLVKWIAARSTWASSFQIRMLSHSIRDLDTANTYENENREAALGPGPGIWWFRFEKRWWWCQLEHHHRENSDRPLETISMGSIGRKPTALQRLLAEAEAENQKPDGMVRVYRQRGNSWETPLLRPARPWSTLTFPPEANALLDDARRFYESERWYRARGIPWRRGYLLYGPPGTGKSSLIHALATELDRDIYLLSLNSLSDHGLEHLMCTMPPGVLVAIEDIDIVQPARGDKPEQKADIADKLGVSLAGLLNALDGIIATEGRLLVCTTNHRDRLDPALTRAGRCDLHIQLPKADDATRSDIQRRIVGHDGWAIEVEDPTPADVQEASIAMATAGDRT
jgi:chaperone BCS1